MIVGGYLGMDKSIPLRQVAHLIVCPTLKLISEASSLLEKRNYTFLAISLSTSGAFLQEVCILLSIRGALLADPFGPLSVSIKASTRQSRCC